MFTKRLSVFQYKKLQCIFIREYMSYVIINGLRQAAS